MNKTVSQSKTAGQKEILLKIKETLREEVLESVKNQGMQKRLFSEFYDLANCTSTLLAILQQERFMEQLGEDDRQKYDSIMTRLSCCGLRAQILLEKSNEAEYESLLNTSEPASGLVN